MHHLSQSMQFIMIWYIATSLIKSCLKHSPPLARQYQLQLQSLWKVLFLMKDHCWLVLFALFQLVARFESVQHSLTDWVKCLLLCTGMITRKKYGKLDDFVASHPELFMIEGDYIQLR